MKTLTKKLKVKWIKALRSGKYKQGEGELEKEGRYCCLGVLQAVEPEIESESPCLLANIRNSRSCIKGLPISKQHVLATMNDDSGKDFKVIADWIEKYINPKL